MGELPGAEFLARVGEVQGLVGDDLAAVPEVALVGGEFLRRRGREDAVGALLGVAPVGGDDPAQRRRLGVDAQRIDQRLDAQAFGAQAGFSSMGGGQGIS
jgi:hypothetical protein